MTMRSLKYPTLALLFVALLPAVQAQSDDVVIRAMSDELERSMNLEIDSIKPFYISYGITDNYQASVSAALGAILTSNGNSTRTKNVRVMTGDYLFNDESLDNPYAEQEFNFGGWSVPLGDDYYGIRRALWETTDNIFRSAVKLYQHHLEYLESNDSTKDDFEARRFQKLNARKRWVESKKSKISLNLIGDRLREASKIFSNYPEIDNSGVVVSVNERTYYFADSEGSRIKVSKSMYSLLLTATSMNDELEQDYAIDYAFSQDLETLIDPDSLQVRVTALTQQLTKKSELPTFDDSYRGPVIFMDNAAAFPLLGLMNQFQASDIKQQQNGYYGQSQSNDLDSKIGNRLGPDDLNIWLTPRLKQFNKVDLLGAYDVDSEGVIPNEQIWLVENGKLKDVMTTRTLAKDYQKSNGTSSGPGVVQISFENYLNNYADMKAKLLEMVAEEQLDYGIIVKHFELNRQLLVIKVYPDGREEEYKGANIKNFDMKSLRNIEYALKERQAHNVAMFGTDAISSIILPKAMIFSDIDIDKGFSRRQPSETLVPNPVQD